MLAARVFFGLREYRGPSNFSKSDAFFSHMQYEMVLGDCHPAPRKWIRSDFVLGGTISPESENEGPMRGPISVFKPVAATLFSKFKTELCLHLREH